MSRDAYQKSHTLDFPANYDMVSLGDTSLVVGIGSNLPISERFALLSKAELAQSVSGDDLHYRAIMPYVGTAEFSERVHRTRGYLAVGIKHQITPNVSVELMPSINYAW